jgi:hypothetical protein
MSTLIIIILGAIMNRFRGSGIPYCRAANVAVFGLLSGFVAGWWFAVPAALGMWAGQSLGWGRYIGALFETEKNKLEEVEWIDSIIKPLKNNMRLWGAAGLALRGYFWSLCIAIALMSPYIQFIGILMPVCYYIAWLISQGNKNPPGAAWERGEILWGAVLWGWIGFITI